MKEVVAWCVAQSSLMLPTLSADDEYEPEMMANAAGWMSTAVMAWREELS